MDIYQPFLYKEPPIETDAKVPKPKPDHENQGLMHRVATLEVKVAALESVMRAHHAGMARDLDECAESTDVTP